MLIIVSKIADKKIQQLYKYHKNKLIFNRLII